jgi:hypothetical protein
MAIRIDLTVDPARGPGYGLLKIIGLPPETGALDFWVERNQGAETFLGTGGQWTTQTVLHSVGAPSDEGGGKVLRLGPEIVDPIATLPPNCLVLMGVEAAGVKEQGRVTVRGLLASSAAGARVESGVRTVRQSEPDPVVVDPEPDPEPMRPLRAEPLDQQPPFVPLTPIVSDPTDLVDRPRRTSPGVVILGTVLVLILVAGGWYFAGLPPFGKGAEAPATPVATAPEPAAPVAVNGPIDSREALSRYIATNPSAEAATAKAVELGGQGHLDFAMLVHQYAARLGSADSAIALGHMYDPDTWSKSTSPMDKPDAETAAYWYEPAAKAGNVEAERRLGKILLGLPGQQDKAKEWLGKAATAGDAEAKTLLEQAK